MDLVIDMSAPTPVYEQIVEQIEGAVVGGQLAAGAPLPRIRQLAHDLSINPNTVARAYQILEQRSVVVTAGRRGTFVHQSGVDHAQAHAEQWGATKMLELVGELRRSGLPTKTIRELFKAAVNHKQT